MRKFTITNSNGSQHSVWFNTKHEANKLARQSEKLLGVRVVSVVEVK